jgi:hypothetical protein
LDLYDIEAERSTTNRDINKIFLPLLPLQDMPEKLFAPRLPHAESKISESLLLEFRGDLHKLWAACARLSGGHPRSAVTLLACISDGSDSCDGPDSWAAVLDRLTSKIADGREQTKSFTAEEILRTLSPSYYELLGNAKVNEWVRTGIMNNVGDSEHVLPAVMLLPFVKQLDKVKMSGIERLLAKRLQLLFSQLGSSDAGEAYEAFYSALLCLLPLVRSQEIQDGVKGAVDWRTCSLMEGLCGAAPESTWKGAYLKDTLTPAVRSRRYDFTQDRTVRVYKAGELAGVSSEDLERHVWIPASRQNAGFDALLFFREVGAGPTSKLTPVAMEYKYSCKTQSLPPLLFDDLLTFRCFTAFCSAECHHTTGCKRCRCEEECVGKGADFRSRGGRFGGLGPDGVLPAGVAPVDGFHCRGYARERDRVQPRDASLHTGTHFGTPPKLFGAVKVTSGCPLVTLHVTNSSLAIPQSTASVQLMKKKQVFYFLIFQRSLPQPPKPPAW